MAHFEFNINTNKNLQNDFCMADFWQLAENIVHEAFAGHEIGYIGYGCMAWETYDFFVYVDRIRYDCVITYKTKIATFTTR